MKRPILIAVNVALATMGFISPIRAELMVGASAVDITPILCNNVALDANAKQFDVRNDCFRWIHLAGFSPYIPFKKDNRLAEGIHDPLWSRALAIQGTNGETVVLVSTDLPGLASKHSNWVRRRVERAYGVPASHIIIHSTHTHSAPDASGFLSTLISEHNLRYTDAVRERIYLSITKALETLEPAEMRVATTTHVSCRDLQTRELKKDPDCRLPNINNEFNDTSSTYDQFLVQRDQRDPIVRNTRIVSAEFQAVAGGHTLATFVNWHNHPDTLGCSNRLISSDYPHYLREYMERARGGISVYFVGTLGSQIGGLRATPVPLWNDQHKRVFAKGPDSLDVHGKRVPVLTTAWWDKIRSTGYEIAHEAVVALASAPASADVSVAVRTESVDTPVDNLIHVFGTWPVWHDDVTWEDRLRYYWPHCWGLLGCVRSNVNLVQTGDPIIITAPGEIGPAYFLGRRASTADYGEHWGTWFFPAMIGVDRYMPGTHHAVIASANDYLSYMIPSTDYVGWLNVNHPNHYEDLVTIGKRFGDDIGRRWFELLEVSPPTSANPIP